MLYRISVTERGLTGIANIFRSRLSRLDDLLGAGTVPLTITVGLVTSRGLCGAFFLGTSSGLIVYVGRSPPHSSILLGLGFHADAAGTYYLFRICFLHVIVFLFLFIHVR